jgi:hypothetical protein
MATYTITVSTPVYAAGGAGAVGGGVLSNVAGALIIGITGEGGIGARLPPTASSGYNNSVAPNVHAPEVAAYPRIATADSETLGSWNWAVANESYAYAYILTPPAGYMVPPLSAFLDGAGVDDQSTSVANLRYLNALTPTQDGDVILAFGHHIRTSATNGATIGSMSPDTGFSTPLMTSVLSANVLALVANAWQQSTATATTGGDVNVMSIAEPSGLNNQTVMLAILAPIPIPASANPPISYDERIIVPRYAFN